MKKIYSIFVLSLILLGINNFVNAQDVVTIASWDFTTGTEENPNANVENYGSNELTTTTANENLIIGGLTRSAAIEETTAGNTTPNRAIWGCKNLSSTNFGNIAKGEMDAKYNDMIADVKYITFTITPKVGATLSLSGIDAFKAVASGSTIRMRMEYKVGDGAFTVFGIRDGATDDLPLSNGSAGVSSKDVDFSEMTELQDIAAGTTVTFRIAFISNETPEKVSVATGSWAGFFNSIFSIKGIVSGQGTGVENTEISNANVSVKDQTIYVQSSEASFVSVYSISGKFISSKTVENGEVDFTIAGKGVYLVKVGNKTFKVIL